MSNIRNQVTADELLRMPADGNFYELIAGELHRLSPAGGRHGRVAHELARLLGNYVHEHELGVVFAAETGFLIDSDPDTVRAPDVAFLSQMKYEQVSDDTGYLPFAPDLAVEVISPHDTFSAVEEKAFAWIEAGTQLVLLVDPKTRKIHAYRSSDSIVVLTEGETLDASDVVNAWHLEVGKLF